MVNYRNAASSYGDYRHPSQSDDSYWSYWQCTSCTWWHVPAHTRCNWCDKVNKHRPLRRSQRIAGGMGKGKGKSPEGDQGASGKRGQSVLVADDDGLASDPDHDMDTNDKPVPSFSLVEAQAVMQAELPDALAFLRDRAQRVIQSEPQPQQPTPYDERHLLRAATKLRKATAAYDKAKLHLDETAKLVEQARAHLGDCHDRVEAAQYKVAEIREALCIPHNSVGDASADNIVHRTNELFKQFHQGRADADQVRAFVFDNFIGKISVAQQPLPVDEYPPVSEYVPGDTIDTHLTSARPSARSCPYGG